MINTLGYVKKLQEAGVSREQAEAHIEIVSEMMDSNFATKQDLKDLAQELRHELALLEQRLTIRLGTIVSVAIGVAVALAKITS